MGRSTISSSGHCETAPRAVRRISFRSSRTVRCTSFVRSVRGAGTTSWVPFGVLIRTRVRTASTTNGAARSTPLITPRRLRALRNERSGHCEGNDGRQRRAGRRATGSTFGMRLSAMFVECRDHGVVGHVERGVRTHRGVASARITPAATSSRLLVVSTTIASGQSGNRAPRTVASSGPASEASVPSAARSPARARRRSSGASHRNANISLDVDSARPATMVRQRGCDHDPSITTLCPSASIGRARSTSVVYVRSLTRRGVQTLIQWRIGAHVGCETCELLADHVAA